MKEHEKRIEKLQEKQNVQKWKDKSAVAAAAAQPFNVL